MSAPVLVTRAGAVATIAIDRPDRLNAMDSHAHLGFSEALDRAAEDPGVRVVVITGTGERAFSAGRDLHELAAERSPDEQSELDARWRRVTRLTDRFDYPKPLIARVCGIAFGGGFEIALACDLIVASDTVRFALPEPRRGLIPSAGGVHRLPRQIPLKAAMGLLLGGEPIAADRAFQLGLVTEVVPVAELDEAVGRWCAALLACSPAALRSIRQQVAQGLSRPLPDAMAATYPAELARAAGPDATEGPRAFAEKRTPVWSSL